jgi:hypothetical protein
MAMLIFISSGTFIKTVLVLTAIYYLFAMTLFYRKEIIQLFTRKSGNDPHSNAVVKIHGPDPATHPDAAGDEPKT